MIKVLQPGRGDAGTLTGCLYLALLLHLTLALAEISEEESKSLWHQLAGSMLVVLTKDRDTFLDLCLRRRMVCSPKWFNGSQSNFHWAFSNVTDIAKERFWHAYACAYNRDLHQCPVDGGWSTWSPWSECSATCDIRGKQSRRRTCSNPVPIQGGSGCQGSMLRSRPCVGLCAVDSDTGVVAGANGGQEEAMAYLDHVHKNFPQLLHDCFEAHCTFSTVQRVISHKNIRDKYWSSLSCVKFGGACPVDGEWGEWSSWSTCSLVCGAGTRTRTRHCDQPPPAFGGHACRGPWHKQESCLGRDCGASTSETFTEWTQWSPCSQSCGGYGAQTSTRVCLRPRGCDLQGVLTPYINRSRPCYLGDCPQVGGWAEWSEWTDCSALCGAGRQSRMRLCDNPYPTGGLTCLGDPLEFRLCEGASCTGHTIPLVAEMAVAEAERPRGNSVVLGGNDQYAAQPLKPALEVLYTPWSAWSYCTVTCGAAGTRARTRNCSPKTTPMPPCEGEVRQIQFCNVYVCPEAGGWSDWMPWTPCSKTCEEGRRYRYRACNNPLPKFGGSCPGDSHRMELCAMPACPQTTDGSWGRWSQWSSCSQSCGRGQRVRQRHRVRASRGHKQRERVSRQVDDFMKEVVDCNSHPCPVQGNWAEWGEWSRCSTICGMGTRARDRTCTDPAPSFGGRACSGHGTDITHCFSGPCRDMEDRAVHLKKWSWMRFSPRNRPTRYLALYLHFKPTAPDGMVLHRYRQCRSVYDDVEEGEGDEGAGDNEDRDANKDSACQMVMDLKLRAARVLLLAEARGAGLSIQSNATLMLGAWHEVLVEVLKSGASLRINDQDRLYANFSRRLVRDLDFDSYMVIGAIENKTEGFEGSICMLSINFRPQDLFSATDWMGQGTPVGRRSVYAEDINPSVQLPHFRGLYYASLRLPRREGLDVRLTLWLDQEDGLILYTRGHSPGSHLSLGVRRTRLNICLRCSMVVRTVCHHASILKLRQWYHVVLSVEKHEAEVRVDQSQATQLTCRGETFTPEDTLFVGGRGVPGWQSVQRATNYTKGFFGTVGTAVINGRALSFRHAALLGRDRRLNPDGYSRAMRITPVFEHKTSVVTLHCNIGRAMDSSVHTKVLWLFSDTVLEPSKTIEIIKPVGGQKQVGTLKLHPGGHREGLYACVVNRNGRLVLSHVYPLFRHISRKEAYEGRLEWVLLLVLLILLPLLGLVCFLLAKFWSRLPCSKKPVPEASPLLSDEVEMDLCIPNRRHLHTQDGIADMQQYLASHDYDIRKVRVKTFGPPHPRLLSVTPGTATRRTLEPVDGAFRLDGDNRPSASVSYLPPGEGRWNRGSGSPSSEHGWPPPPAMQQANWSEPESVEAVGDENMHCRRTASTYRQPARTLQGGRGRLSHLIATRQGAGQPLWGSDRKSSFLPCLLQPPQSKAPKLPSGKYLPPGTPPPPPPPSPPPPPIE